MAVLVRSEVSVPSASGNTALLTGPIIYESYLPSPPLSPEDGGYFYSDTKDASGGVYPDKYYFRSKCQPDDRLFSVVYQFDRDTVATADASRPFIAVGIIISRSGDNTCTVQRYGACVGFSNLRTDTNYVLGNNGSVVATPLPENAIEFVQQVGQAVSDTTLFINPTGSVVRRDIEKDGTASVGPGEPNIQQVYPPENVYINQTTGDWYTMPAGTDELTHFYVGLGAPSDAVTYPPRAVYVDQLTGAYYVQGETGNSYVPISSGRGQPDQVAPNTYRVIYINQDTGEAYYG